MEKLRVYIEEKLKSAEKLDTAQLKEKVVEGGETEEITIDNHEYQIDLRYFYDDRKRGIVRVTASAFEPKKQRSWLFWKNIEKAILTQSTLVDLH